MAVNVTARLRRQPRDCFEGTDASPHESMTKGKIREDRKSRHLLSFTGIQKKYEWVISPFVKSESTGLTMAEKGSIIDHKNDLVHRGSIADQELSALWISILSQYPIS